MQKEGKELKKGRKRKHYIVKVRVGKNCMLKSERERENDIYKYKKDGEREMREMEGRIEIQSDRERLKESER